MTRARVLVVDDEYGIRSGIQQILEMEAYEVVAVGTGREGLAALGQGGFDLVLIDYQLPDMDGLAVLRELRGAGLDASTCMITAYANIDMAIAATRQGIDFFLPKPFSPEDLLGVVETLLRHRAVREEAARLRREHEANLLALDSEKSQTRTLVGALRDAVLVVNREGSVVLVNAALAALLGRPEAEFVHRPAAEVLGGEALRPLRELLAGTEARRVAELELGERTFVASATRYSDAGGVALGETLLLSDITEVRRAALEKSRFIRTMVHELRSPLGSIRSLIEVAIDGSLGPEREKYLPMLGRAEARIDNLVELVGDLLSLSRIDLERGSDAGCADVTQAVAAAVDVAAPRAVELGLRLTFEVAADAGAARIDPEGLRTILDNLVGNAVKYNRRGGAVCVRAARRGGAVNLEITDTGLGIAAANLPHLFEEFFREKRPETRGIPGHGLGLAIVKRLIDRAGGRIDVRSVQGDGTTFLVELPAATVELPPS